MTVKSCGTNDNLERAAQIMWENDFGAVPVVDGDGRVVGMITDRDSCMAAYMQGRPLGQILVSNAMSKRVHGAMENDPLEVVENMMRRVRVRRVPVLDAKGRLNGILSMNDLVRHAHRSLGRTTSVGQTIAAICEPHVAARAKDHGQGR